MEKEIPQQKVLKGTEAEAEAKAETNKPKVFMKSNIKLTMWANKLDDGRTMYSYNITKVYKDKEGEWQESNSFNLFDLNKVKSLLRNYLDFQTPFKVK